VLNRLPDLERWARTGDVVSALSLMCSLRASHAR
jgi:hypothetical protein